MIQDVENGQVYTVKAAARSTGLSAHVLRVWEKRYGAVVPHRTSTGRRVYTEADIERLRLLREATTWGHAIGQIATLPSAQLKQLVRRGRETGDRYPVAAEVSPLNGLAGEEDEAEDVTPDQVVKLAIAAVTALDSSALEKQLSRSLVLWSRPRVMDDVVVPLMHLIGEGWRTGELRIAQEHMASAVVRTFLGDMVRAHGVSQGAPTLVVTTPAGQHHEIGALMVAAVAAAEGWRVIYLGPDLPAEEIAAAVFRGKAKAVALSLVHPIDDPDVNRQLLQLRQLLPTNTTIFAGGRALEAYESTLKNISALRLPTLIDLRHALEALRQQISPH
jgi:methanogenic corrinoid protein MtbC1/transposase-like protein